MKRKKTCTIDRNLVRELSDIIFKYNIKYCERGVSLDEGLSTIAVSILKVIAFQSCAYKKSVENINKTKESNDEFIIRTVNIFNKLLTEILLDTIDDDKNDKENDYSKMKENLGNIIKDILNK